LQVKSREAEDVVRQAGTSQLISVQIEGAEPVQALVRDLQLDVIRGNLLHVDLYQVDMSQSITVEVPLLLVGESPVVEQGQGILLQGIQSVEIECLPGDLFDALEVDLSVLAEVDQQITVGDLAVPSTITVLSSLDDVVARVTYLVEELEEEEEEEDLFEMPVAEPELVGREREEEEEE
jgi:large subunit ribosomal protein L25